MTAGRDGGPYSTRNTSKGALLPEARAVFTALAAGRTLPEVREACLTGRLLRQSARETRNRIWDALHWRFFAWGPPRFVLADLCDAAVADASDRRFAGMACLHYVRRDRLTFEFVTGPLWARWRRGDRAVSRDLVLDFIADCREREPAVGRWRETTRAQLAGRVLSALRDFGLLQGAQRKSLHRPAVAPGTVLHLCRLLEAEGLRGRGVLEADDWRALLHEPHDVALALGQLAQRGAVRFERSGKTVVLELPRHDAEAAP